MGNDKITDLSLSDLEQAILDKKDLSLSEINTMSPIIFSKLNKSNPY